MLITQDHNFNNESVLVKAIYGKLIWALSLVCLFSTTYIQVDSYCFNSGVIPVLHNLEPRHVDEVSRIVLSLEVASVSLRHPTAMAALKTLKNNIPNTNFQIGASSVTSEYQVSELADIGVSFVSTMFYSPAIIRAARHFNIPILCGCQSFNDANAALLDGAETLKFFPSNVVTPSVLRSTLHALKQRGSLATSSACSPPIIIAGGVKLADISEYSAAGITGVAFGFDCNRSALELESSWQQVKQMEQLLKVSNYVS